MPTTSYSSVNASDEMKHQEYFNESGMKEIKERSWFKFAAGYGVLAGLAMGIYSLLMNADGSAYSLGWKFIQYIFLFGVLYVALARFKTVNPARTFFRRGIGVGATVTTIGAAVVTVIDIAKRYVGQENALDDAVNTASEAGVGVSTFGITGSMFFVSLVFGMILTFICLQMLKPVSNTQNVDPQEA